MSSVHQIIQGTELQKLVNIKKKAVAKIAKKRCPPAKVTKKLVNITKGKWKNTHIQTEQQYL